MTTFCAAALAASVLSGCTSTRDKQTHDGHEHANHGSARSEGPTGPAEVSARCDVQFVVAMIPHHQQAVQMSDLALYRASDRRIIELAVAITRAQRVEIAVMKEWLRAVGVPLAHGHDAGQEHRQHAADMLGMLTPAQLGVLSSASGTTFDEMFLRAMIRHHRGALTMAEQVLHVEGSPVVRNLAVDMAVSQRYEIVGMRRTQIELETGRMPNAAELARMMATERFDEPLPAQKTMSCDGPSSTP
jgi:uncharacterized protein (DUF305 family)